MALRTALRLSATTMVVALAGCSSAGTGPASEAAASRGGETPPTPAAISPTVSPAPAATAATVSPDAWLVVGRKGAPGLEVILARTGERIYELQSGAPAAPDWGRLATASLSGTATNVRHLVVQPGFGGEEVRIDGAWRLPAIGYDPTPVGLSLDGSTIVLVPDEPPPTASARSRFAVLSFQPLVGPARIIELAGRFEFDAISPDGKTLYVVEHLSTDPGGRYQVRAVDVATARLKEGVIADKRNLGEAMAGWPIAQLRASNGRVFTLYRGPEHPFVHALDTVQGYAVCIDLPAARAEDDVAGLDWGLAAPAGEGAIFAINATLGLAVDIDPDELTLRRSVAGAHLAAAQIVLAKFGHTDGGPVGRRVVVAPDGKTVYAAGANGILSIRTTELSVAGRYVEGRSVAGLGLTPDGRAMFALLADEGRIVQLRASTGQVIGEVPGDGYDRLLAIMPW